MWVKEADCSQDVIPKLPSSRRHKVDSPFMRWASSVVAASKEAIASAMGSETRRFHRFGHDNDGMGSIKRRHCRRVESSYSVVAGPLGTGQPVRRSMLIAEHFFFSKCGGYRIISRSSLVCDQLPTVISGG